MKSFLMMSTNDAKEFTRKNPALEEENRGLTITHHEDLMRQYKSMAAQVVHRMSQISSQIKLLSIESEELGEFYQDLFTKHSSHRKEWEKLTIGKEQP